MSFSYLLIKKKTLHNTKYEVSTYTHLQLTETVQNLHSGSFDFLMQVQIGFSQRMRVTLRENISRTTNNSFMVLQHLSGRLDLLDVKGMSVWAQKS